MKKSDLIRVIREVVKREVKSAIKEELKVLKEDKKPDTPKDFSKMMEHASSLIDNKPKQEFTKDKKLNEALNQTATSEWPTMGNKTFSANDAPAGKSGMAAMMGMQSPDQAFGGKPTINQMLPDDRKHVEIEPELEQALTRDYSSLMKAIDKKKGI